jgi:hypothetical protein
MTTILSSELVRHNMPTTESLSPRVSRPCVLLVGGAAQADFGDAVAALRETAQLTEVINLSAACEIARSTPPELIVVAQSRPGSVSARQVRQLQRRAPLAGIVALVGSWCEGETRTGRPQRGVDRLYWYEFPWWWQRQLVRRRAGRCPEWARPEAGWRGEGRNSLNDQRRRPAISSRTPHGLIAISTSAGETYAALADGLLQHGFATAWQRPGNAALTLGGVTAGVWEGGQLSAREADQLAAFCRQCSRGAAPVVALLDYPRHDSCQRAVEAGAATVLGKPWASDDLVLAIDQAARPQAGEESTAAPARAA